MTRLAYFFILFLFSPYLFGQQAYYVLDSTKIIGVKLIDGGAKSNARFVQLMENGQLIKLMPDKYSEYGLQKGRVYKSFLIDNSGSISNYFLERVSGNKVTFYYLKLPKGESKYYLSDGADSLLKEIPNKRAEYTRLFEHEFNDCTGVAKNIQFVKLKRTSITRFSHDYEECQFRPHPHFRYGLMAGINTTRLLSTSEYAQVNFSNSIDFSAGVFADIPINYVGLTFHPELQFKKLGYQHAFNDQSRNYDLVVNYSTVSLPMLFRYTFLKESMSPFLQIGGVYSTAIINDGKLFRYETTGNTTTIEINDSVISNAYGGFIIGVGVLKNYAAKNSIFGDLRYTGYYGLEGEESSFNMSEFSLSIGLIF